MKRLCLVFCILFITFPGEAAEVSMHGFLQGTAASRLTGDEPVSSEGGDFISGEERFRLELSSKSQTKNVAFTMKTDLFHDSIVDDADIDLREAYLDYGAERYDARIGRQIITWGVADLIFINDIFPKDYVALFSGKPLEYLKIGSDAAKFSLYTDFASADLVIMPFFEGNNLPTSARFFLYDPYSSVSDKTTEKPRAEIENTELALRVSKGIMGFDSSIYIYKGYFRLPGAMADNMTSPTSVTYIYPALAVYGASAQGSAFGGVLSLEAGYYDSLDDRRGTDPAVSNSQIRYLLGYQRQGWTDFTIGIQYYGEYMEEYSRFVNSLPAGSPRDEEYRDYITLRLTQFLRYQTIRLSLFAFLSPSDEDYYVIPEIKYNISDEMWLAAGGNIFGGRRETTFFGQLEKNDNIYVTLRYEF